MIVVLLVSGMAFYTSSRKDAVLASSLEASHHAVGVREGIFRAQTYAQEILDMTRLVPQDAVNAEFAKLLAVIDLELNALLNQDLPDQLRAEANALETAFSSWCNRAVVLLGVEPAANIPTLSSLSKSSDVVGAQANEVSRLAATYATQAFTETNRALSKITLFGLVGTALLMAAAVIFAIKRARVISNAMQSAASRLGHLADKEEETGRGSRSEMAEVFQALDTLETSLEEKRRIAERLLEEKARAEAATEAKSRFLATMSHEIRTPINGVLGMAQILNEMRLGPEQRSCATTIMASSEALLRIVNDILDFSKLEAGKDQLLEQTFDLRELIYDVALLMAPTANGKGVEICLDIPDETPAEFVGDSGRVRQILMNLVGNAVKFTPAGHIVVALRYNAAQVAPVCISVEDTGVGIPEESRGQIFQAFEQVESTVSRRFEGTGLGLAISAQLADAMEGGIEVTSELGKGSCFTVRLNLPVVPAPICATRPLLGKSVVVVADLVVPQKIRARQLRSWGALTVMPSDLVRAAETVAEQVASGSPPDVVLVETGVPLEEARSLCASLHALEGCRQLPIIFCTDSHRLASYESLKECKTLRVLMRPVRNDTLLRAMLETLGGVVELTPHQSAKPAPHSSSLKLSDLRILVAEDNQTNQLVLQKMLASTGVDLTICADGKEAVEIFAAKPFDLVLMDMSMPVMDGLEATREIRKLEATRGVRSTPVLALTANVLNADEEACLKAGMVDFLTKPIKKALLIEKIEQWADYEAQVPAVGSGAQERY